jgi:Ca2+-binding RTX toxin-like protein
MDVTPPAVASNAAPPVSYVTAVWLGMSPQDIAQGIFDGVVAAPPGWGTVAAQAESFTPQSVEVPEVMDVSDKPDGKPLLVDRERVAALFKALDASLDDAGFDAIWTNAGTTDAARAETLVDLLTRSLLGAEAPKLSDGASVGDRLAANTAALDAYVSDATHKATVVQLAGKSGSDLVALAKGDPAYRYALLHLDPVAIVGNPAVGAAGTAPGELNRFDPNTGEQNISDAWLEDRAKFLAWKLQAAAGEEQALDGDQSWTFVDRRSSSPDGTPYELRVHATVEGGTTNTVVFGADSESGEILKGGSGTDRIYGGSGDDVLRGNAGGDHLEGGRGDDLVLGGQGNDDLSGDQGSDEIDGGAGGDRLRGGAGDDVLTGGRGDDRLEGGSGHDTYIVDSGDGNDIIVDSDGDGEVQVDGARLSGAQQKDGTTWRTDDGRIRFAFSGDATEGGTLTISYYAANAGDDAVPEAVTNVAGWHNGDLGITLGDGSTAAIVPSQDAASPQQPPHNETIPPIPHDDGTSGSDGQGSTWIDPGSSGAADSEATSLDTSNSDAMASVDVTDLFDQLARQSDFADSLVTPAALHAGAMAWDGVAEAPDIGATHQDASVDATGLTPSDLTDALADFLDAGHDFADHALAAPSPDVAGTSMQIIGTSEGVSSGAGADGVLGTGQRPRP